MRRSKNTATGKSMAKRKGHTLVKRKPLNQRTERLKEERIRHRRYAREYKETHIL